MISAAAAGNRMAKIMAKDVLLLGSGCITVVEHSPYDPKVKGSNPDNAVGTLMEEIMVRLVLIGPAVVAQW